MTSIGKPKVFISYTWLYKKDTDGKQIRVPDQRTFDLAERLRKAGVDSRLDIYFIDNHYGFVQPERVPGDNRDPWIIWAEEQIRDADCVLLFCTHEYVASDPDRGECSGEWCNWHQLDDNLKLKRSVPLLWWDWHYIAQECKTEPQKFIPVGVGPYDSQCVPAFVKGAAYYNMDSTKEFEGLVRRIRSAYLRRHPQRGFIINDGHKDDYWRVGVNSQNFGEGGAMTDEEYLHFLTALAGKHLRYPQPHQAADLRKALDHVSGTFHLLKVVKDREDTVLLNHLIDDLEDSPVRKAKEGMEASGILDALDDAHDVVLGELRRSAIPRQDEEYLRRAGFDTDDIEVLLVLAVHRAHALGLTDKLPSDIVDEAAQAMQTALQSLRQPEGLLPAKKKRKIFNGIGKLLGGAVLGMGNVLLVTGTLVAPNPATAYGAIVSGGTAIASFFAGIGDLKGE